MSDFQYDHVDENEHRLTVLNANIRNLEQLHLTTKMSLENLPDGEEHNETREALAFQLSDAERQILDLRKQRDELVSTQKQMREEDSAQVEL